MARLFISKNAGMNAVKYLKFDAISSFCFSAFKVQLFILELQWVWLVEGMCCCKICQKMDRTCCCTIIKILRISDSG